MLLPKFNLFDAEQKVFAMVQPGSVQLFSKLKSVFFCFGSLVCCSGFQHLQGRLSFKHAIRDEVNGCDWLGLNGLFYARLLL